MDARAQALHHNKVCKASASPSVASKSSSFHFFKASDTVFGRAANNGLAWYGRKSVTLSGEVVTKLVWKPQGIQVMSPSASLKYKECVLKKAEASVPGSPDIH